MNIDVILTPAEIDLLPDRDLRGSVCVVFDILRATSTMVTALANGVRCIHPVRTIEEALALKQQRPGALLGGERHGDRIEGFDLGNSPLEYRDIAATEIITTTTNGTIALRACEHAGRVIAGAILNLDAIVHMLSKDPPEELLLVCAGTFRNPALEDLLAAGMLAREFPAARYSDAARVVQSLTETHAGRTLEALEESANGQVLIGKQRHQEVKWCAQRSIYPVIGEMKNGIISPVGDPCYF
jgi:2-phosphosulfolactate phosphatase